MIKKIKKTLKNLTGQVGRKLEKRPSKIDKAEQPKKLESQEGGSNAKVLMFGWELPPFNSGGLGVACYELAQSLTGKNTTVTFVLPRKVDVTVPFMRVSFAKDPSKRSSKSLNNKLFDRNSKMKLRAIDSALSPYLDEQSYQQKINKINQLKHSKNCLNLNQCEQNIYADDLMGEVERYGDAAEQIALEEDFTVIHAHDWLSYPAGIRAKEVSGKPLITHVHAIEYDRSHEGGVNQQICKIEKAGLEASDKIIAVSGYTKHRIHDFYGIPLDKIEVVHNGINSNQFKAAPNKLKTLKKSGNKMVLFVGRITYQKGVDYFVEAAYKALQINPKIIFMVAGSGDMMYQIINQAAYYGISDKVFFPGFIRGDELDNLYHSADVYVMPSVSEPFGLVALEALSKKVPVIVSKQSGASEVLKHALKVNFWDTDELANKIVAVINNPALRYSLSKNGYREVENFTWDSAADKCIKIYNQLAAI